MNERLNRFISLLKQIFELDKSDLDFGIYRVMNLRKAQIEEFLTERLPQMVQETLAPFAQGSKEEIRAKMKQIEDSVSEMGMTVDALPDTAQKKQQYLQLQKQLAEGADLAALETDVYSALYSFFNRYYEDGDFISKRRYKEGVYAIPYEGEEVKLYWANQDQYYIKTSENFKDYTFVFDGITVHFRLVDATTEQNNNKESKDSKRTFMLFTEDEENYPGIKRFEYDPDAAEIVIRFVYDIPADKKKKNSEENYAAAVKSLLLARGFGITSIHQIVIGSTMSVAQRLCHGAKPFGNKYFVVSTFFAQCLFLTNNKEGDTLLKLILHDELAMEINRAALSPFHPPRIPTREYDAIETSLDRPVLLNYQCDLLMLSDIHPMPEGFRGSPIMLCFDYQTQVIQRIVGPAIEVRPLESRLDYG